MTKRRYVTHLAAGDTPYTTLSVEVCNILKIGQQISLRTTFEHFSAQMRSEDFHFHFKANTNGRNDDGEPKPISIHEHLLFLRPTKRKAYPFTKRPEETLTSLHFFSFITVHNREQRENIWKRNLLLASALHRLACVGPTNSKHCLDLVEEKRTRSAPLQCHKKQNTTEYCRGMQNVHAVKVEAGRKHFSF